MTLADRIVVMKEGYVQQIGTPYELYYDPVNVFVAGFIGEPPMNFIKGKVKGGKLLFGKNELDLSRKLGAKTKDWEGKDLVFAFRPEAIELGKQEDSYHITADVELTEMLGDNTNVYITAGEDKAILKVDPHDTPDVDSSLTFSIPVKSVYLFDVLVIHSRQDMDIVVGIVDILAALEHLAHSLLS
jgi:multiple sugar transport system ATP-binding protein